MSLLTTKRLLAMADWFLLMADCLRPPLHARIPAPEEGAALAMAVFSGEEESRLALLGELCASFCETSLEAWSDEYHRLFEGPLVCPINETAYIRRDKGALLADLCGFYRAFGFEGSPDSGEKPDHLRCELEFMAALLVMFARAIEEDCESGEEVTRAAIRAFVVDHLGEWLPSFCVRLGEAARLEAYRRWVLAMVHGWRSCLRELGVPEAPEVLPQPALVEGFDEDVWPIECGMGGAQANSSSPLTVEGAHLSPEGLEDRAAGRHER